MEYLEEKPGHVTPYPPIHAAYLRWCEEHEPDKPLSHLLGVIERCAPIERGYYDYSRRVPVFMGIILRRQSRA